MKIPPQFEKLLAKDQNLHGAVLQTLSDFEPWLKDNKTVFFPEYTDHGPDHVERVMNGAESLIRDESWEYLTPQDAGVLLLSILLHDCAMHLSIDGFLCLIDPAPRWTVTSQEHFIHCVQGEDKRTWPLLWDDFKRQASRYDQGKLNALFGDTEPINQLLPLPADSSRWNDRHRLLIGEFMRKQHARLAHEIALEGIPGPGKERIRFARMETWMRDLAGYIARSHNEDLRKASDRTRMPRGGRAEYRKVHAPFLMALLRVADYLEIDATRAPKELLQVKRLRSPVSQREWKKHEAVKDLRLDEDDNEALFVDADIRDVHTYLGLKDLLYGPWGIQKELDSSWAVLGEVYGKDAKLRALGLCIRRIRSSLDGIERDFKEGKIDFVPVQAKYRASGEVLKLLVGPLYGEDPSYGVRELMQNAVDARRELEDYARQNPGKDLEQAELEADVVVRVEEDEQEEDKGWLTVEDRGIGMRAETVLGYFLTAGASFRNSEAWHKQHTDGEGKPRVIRSGRFGIGVLAAYLIGERIEVSTRHVGEKQGIYFECRLEDETIELKRCERGVGTTVRVRIEDGEVLDVLAGGENTPGDRWDWYCLERPSVVRKLRVRRLILDNKGKAFDIQSAGQEITLTRNNLQLPTPGEPLPIKWVRLKHPEFEDIHWSHLYPIGAFVLNGIPLGPADDFWRRGEALRGKESAYLWNPHNEMPTSVRILRPTVSVFDRLGKLPINLWRIGLATPTAPFDQPLLEQVCRYMLGALILNMPASIARFQKQFGTKGIRSLENRLLRMERIMYDHFRRWCALWWNDAGIGLSDTANLADAGNHHYAFMSNGDAGLCSASTLSLRGLFATDIAAVLQDELGNYERANYRSLAIWMSGFFTQYPFDGEGIGYWGPYRNLTRRSSILILPHERYHEPSKEAIQRHGHELKPTGVQILSDRWLLLWTGEDPRARLDLDYLASVKPKKDQGCIALWLDCEAPTPTEPISPLAKAWKDIIRQPIIPWDLDERRRVLAHAYQELAEEIDHWKRFGKRWR